MFTTQMDQYTVSLIKPGSFEAEQYRTLRDIVEQRKRTKGTQVVGVSSPSAGDGKTITALNLAGALAQTPEAKVLLMDMDLRQSAVASRFGLDESARFGLVDAIRDIALEDMVWHFAPQNLSVLLAGSSDALPYEVLKSPKLEGLMRVIRERYDYIVVDTPPMVGFPDCRVISRFADGFIIVVRAHKTPRKFLAEALDIMEPDKVLGLVFNGDDGAVAQYDSYLKYYYISRSARKGNGGSFMGRGARFFHALLRERSVSPRETAVGN